MSWEKRSEREIEEFVHGKKRMDVYEKEILDKKGNLVRKETSVYAPQGFLEQKVTVEYDAFRNWKNVFKMVKAFMFMKPKVRIIENPPKRITIEDASVGRYEQEI